MKTVLSRRASAFRTHQGAFYALFETYYDTGSPNLDSTKCVAFGTLHQVLAWIFASLGEYELGISRSFALPDAAETVLMHWRQALRRPDRQFTQPVWLDASSGADGTIPTSSRYWMDGNMLPRAVSILLEHGYETVAARVRKGEKVILDLHRDAGVLSSIYGYDASHPYIAPWRIVQPHGEGEGDPAMAPSTRSGKVSIPAMSFHHVGGNMLMLKLKGHPAIFGSRDEVFQSFCNTIALSCELRGDGGGTQAIAALRTASSKRLCRVESGSGFIIDVLKLFTDPDQRALASLTQVLGSNVPSLSGRPVFPADALRSMNALDTLAGLPGHALTYVGKSEMPTIPSGARSRPLEARGRPPRASVIPASALLV